MLSVNAIGSKRLTREDESPATKRLVSVVIPALNEEDGIGGTIGAIPVETLSRMGFDTEIIVVDNGSTDRTAEVARQQGAKVVHEPRRGYGRAYRTGFEHANGSIVATIDADMTYPVENIPDLVSALETESLDFITTDRFAYLRYGAMSPQHRWGNIILSLTVRLLFRVNLNDSQSGMWVFRKHLLSDVTVQSDGMAFSQELKIEACHFAKCRWKEIPIEYRTRVGSVKLRSWRDGSENLVWLLTKRVTRHKLPTTVNSGPVR